jgi:hypothetical protein
MPSPSASLEEVLSWNDRRSDYFRVRFITKVIELKNEFAQVHVRDEWLDDFFMRDEVVGQVASSNRQKTIIPQGLEQIAERLRVLANQVNPKDKPVENPIRFVEQGMISDRQDAPYAIRVIVQTSRELSNFSLETEFSANFIFAGHVAWGGVTSLSEGHPAPNLYRLNVYSPSWKVENPLILTAYAQEPIHVKSVKLLP